MERGWRGAYDLGLAVLALASVALAVLYDLTTDATLRARIEVADLVLVAVFLADWLWAVRRDPDPRRKAMRSSWELLGMVPLLLPVPDFLRFLRLARIVRVFRVFRAARKLLGTSQRVAQQSNLGSIAIASSAITLIGALLVWAVEHQANERLATFEESLWWAVVTVTTVGYGDITPVTATGRAIAAVLMVAGIGTIGLLASSLASVLVADRKRAAAEAATADGSGSAGAGGAGGAGVAAAEGDLVARLERLARLRESGHLGPDEFAAAKRLLLGGKA